MRYTEEKKEQPQPGRRRVVVENDDKGNIWFRGEINGRTAHDFELTLQMLEQNPGIESIIIHLSTPGGEVQSSLFMYDLLRTCQKPVIVIIQEMACSGGSIVICGADTVLAYESSAVMIHEIQNSIYKDMSHTAMKKDVEYQEIIMKRMLSIYNERTNRKGVTIEKKNLESDWWMNADQAKKIGLIDTIIPAIPRPEPEAKEEVEPAKKSKKKVK